MKVEWTAALEAAHGRPTRPRLGLGMASGMVLAGGVALAAVVAGLTGLAADTPLSPANGSQMVPVPVQVPVHLPGQLATTRDAGGAVPSALPAALPAPGPLAVPTSPSPATQAAVQGGGAPAAGTPAQTAPGPASTAELALGLRYLPGSQPVAGSERRVPDGAGGEAVSVQLMGGGTLESATQFYQAQLAAPGAPPGAVQVQQPAPGQVLLHVRDPRSNTERTVWIVRNGDQLGIVLARTRQGPSQTP